MASAAKQKWKSAATKINAVNRLSHRTHVAFTGLPEGTSLLHSHEDLSAKDQHTLKALVRRASSESLNDQHDANSFWVAAALSVVIGVASVIPYNLVLKSDPGSPLFVSFALHLVIIAKGLPNAKSLLINRGIPLRYHAAIIFCGCMFVALKSDAYTRLPASLCMMLSNLRMLVGVLVQYVLFKKKYSAPQLLGVLTVTIGIAWASQAMQSAKAAGKASSSGAEDLGASDFSIGIMEIFGSSLSLALLSSLVKMAFSTYGEHVEEQIFYQHLVGIFVVFPSQWDKVGPRMGEWLTNLSNGEYWLWFNLLASVISTFAARGAASQMAGRSPNLLMTQLVQTLECFLQLLVVALINVPPFPPLGFWGGTVVLIVGTLHYLRASAPPQEQHQK
eukprot:gb/GFBE01015737.1/.p1 GENE.gb/GFBE01015737.1/~~gb/GFBE01015737.1/.p1  ORF type:complete len:390 (+),score=62.07 gb/GFBE01015737.1/:1-1170(+)